MKRGDMILVDELNLAEDAVLERLNRYGQTGAGGGQSDAGEVLREDSGVL